MDNEYEDKTFVPEGRGKNDEVLQIQPDKLRPLPASSFVDDPNSMSSDEYANFVHHHRYAVSRDCKRRKMDSISSIVEVVSSPPDIIDFPSPIDERISPARDAMSSTVSSLIDANILKAVVEENPGALLQSDLSEITTSGEVNSNNSSKVKKIRPDKPRPASSFVTMSSDKCANIVHDHRYAVSQDCEKRKIDSTSFISPAGDANALSSPDIPVSPTLYLLPKKNSSSNVATKVVHAEPSDIQSPTQGANITISSKRNEERFADLSPMEAKSKVQLLEERHEDVSSSDTSVEEKHIDPAKLQKIYRLKAMRKAKYIDMDLQMKVNQIKRQMEAKVNQIKQQMEAKVEEATNAAEKAKGKIWEKYQIKCIINDLPADGAIWPEKN